MLTTMMWRSLSLFALLLGVSSISIAGEKPNFTGQWQAEPAAGADKVGAPAKRTIEQDGVNIHIVDTVLGPDAKEQTLDIKCTTNGQQCAVKAAAHEGQVSFYYLGQMLVEIDSNVFGADSVVKRQIKLSEDGKNLTVEIVSIVPPGKPAETVTLKRIGKAPGAEVTSAKPAPSASEK